VAISASQMVISNYQWNQNEDKVPAVVSGKYVVFYEELSSTMRITEIEATEQYVYYLYPDFDVIAVYDWIGTYQYSLAFHPANNSVMRIRCDDGLLYILDSEYYEYVFSGNELLCKYEVTDITNTHSTALFSQEPDCGLTREKNILYSTSGEKIMEIPGVLY
jgi:hypothetical protein